MEATESRPRWKIGVPHTYFLLFIIVVLCAAATWIVPAGTFDRVKHQATGRTVIDPDSFHSVEQTPVGAWGMLKAFQTGMEKSSAIIFFIFIIGGAFTILQDTGAIDAGITRLANKLQTRQNWLLIVIAFLFSVLGGTMGLAEEVIVFIPMAIALCAKLKLDRMVALGITMIGARIGFTTGLANPFTVGVAQGLADLPIYSGLGYRLIWYAAILVVSCAYIVRYANKIKSDPTKSALYGIEIEEVKEEDMRDVPFTLPRKLILLEVLACFIVMFYGVFKLGWYLTELSAIFLLMGLLAGVTARANPNAMARSFVAGTRDMAFAALVVGVARTILVVLQSGQIVDTIIYHASEYLTHLPTVVAALGMYIFQLLLNFLIPSGSGQASATIPIMAPLSDMLGITRQTAVLAFHYGDGFTNLCFPTVGALMASLGIAKVPYDRYIKWIMPLLLIWLVIGGISVAVATIIRLGPF